MKLLLCIFFLIAFSTECSSDVGTYSGEKSHSMVELNFFWSHRCPHCLEALPFIKTLEQKYAWLKVNSFDLFDNPQNVKRYIEMAAKLNRQANAVPAFIFCNQILMGFDSAAGIGQILETGLNACHLDVEPNPKISELHVPLFGKVDYQQMSLPIMTVLIASMDAFNPCAFFVLLFLLSLLVNTRSRLRMLTIGLIFVIFSGIVYFAFMAAWLNLFLLTGKLKFITLIAGVAAITIGSINLKDFYFKGSGISVSIPESAKPNLYLRIRKLIQEGRWYAMIIATVILAIVANSYELLCTAGLPMIYTRVLTLENLPSSEYYLYLVGYNLVYILPLLLIVSFFTLTFEKRKLKESQGRMLKLMSGLMMMGLGGLLAFAPQYLNDMRASLSIFVISIVLTVIYCTLKNLRKQLN